MKSETREINYVWVTRSFLDYRIPVYKAFDELVGQRFHLVYSSEYIPARVNEQIKQVLGDRAIGLSGEWKIGPEDNDGFANNKYTMRLNPKVLKYLYKLSPDVIICDGFFKWTLPALLYKTVFRKKVVVCYERTFHTERKAQKVRLFYRKLMIKFIDAMSCNGSLCEEYTASLGMPKNKMTTGHMVADVSGIRDSVKKVSDQEIAALKSQLGIQGLIYLYVGKLTRRKGVSELVREWELAFGSGEYQATLLIIGEGELSGELSEFAKACKSSIRLLGKIDYNSLGPYFAASDAFVIATLEDNWSLVVPEAMSARLPILTSRYNGCWPELVLENENGWIFDPLKKGSLASRLSESYEARSRFSVMGDKSEEIINLHTPDHAAAAVHKACSLVTEE